MVLRAKYWLFVIGECCKRSRKEGRLEASSIFNAVREPERMLQLHRLNI